MKSISKYISSALMIAAMGCALTSCDDWTEPEHIDLGYGTIDTANPAAYEKYLANLREYRTRPHKQVYAWFNNAETAFGSQGHRVTALPDSIDVVVINNPDKVTNQMVQEMYDVRVNKGQQFSYCVSYDDIKADYTALCEELAAKRIEFTKENGEEAPIPDDLKDPDIVDYTAKAAASKLSHFNTVGFDCIMAGFTGKSTLHMTSAEIAEYNRQINSFLLIIKDWSERHPEVALDLYCTPQYTPSYILEKARYVFFSDSENATNANMFTLYLNMAGNAVAENHVGMVASVPDASGEDSKLGYFAGNKLAVDGLADWTAANAVGAAGILNAGDDYFLTTGQYSNIRRFIQTINPSAK